MVQRTVIGVLVVISCWLVFLAGACVAAPDEIPWPAPHETGKAVTAPATKVGSEEEMVEEVPPIPDPLQGFNNAMFEFNDKLYFWFMKPTAQVYSAAVPQDFRVAFNNFFRNLATPVRFVNSLLQLKFKEAGNELVRLVVNSTIGVGGLGDPAKTELGISYYDADTGQTLGAYGVNHGFYLVLPVFGPSSLRDAFGLAGDRFLTPLTWIGGDVTFGESLGILGFDMVNKTSLRIGDYESFKEAAIDPYESMRDAYVQNRKKVVEEGRTGLERVREANAQKTETGDK